MNEVDDYSSSLITLSVIIIIVLGFFGWVRLTTARIDSDFQDLCHNHYVTGVRFATEFYSKQYSMDLENLKTISEGYLLKEDIDKYHLGSNPVNVDKQKASKAFLEILSGNTNVPVDKLKSMDINMVHIYSNYKLSGGKLLTYYNVEILDTSGNNKYESRNFISLADVQGYVESVMNIKTDIANSINEEVHKNQSYSRTGKTGDNQTSYSTYNTYMCVLRNIPLKGIFNTQKTISFVELQTYSSER